MAELYLIGLTGNIACGKTSVTQMLRDAGAAVMDADEVTRAVQQPGEPVYRAIVEAFGEVILTHANGPIDRKKLGALVFQDAEKLRELEQIVHPAVRARMQQWVHQQYAHALTLPARHIAVIDAIKLIESGWTSLCQAVWVVTCTTEQQRERLVRTRGLTEEEAAIRIDAQSPQSSKVAHATLVIGNSGSLDSTRAQVEQALAQIRGEVQEREPLS